MKTLLFDFGNVIGFFDHGRAIGRLVHYTDLPPTELALALYGSPIEDAYEKGRLSTSEYVESARANARLTCSEAEFLEAYVDIFWRNEEVCGLVPRLARRYRLLLASNTNLAHADKFRAQFADVLTHFDHLGTSYEAGARKPHPEFFSYLQQFTQAPPHDCLFIDDLPSNTAAARDHGWRTIDYRPGQDLELQLVSQGIRLD